MLSTYLWVAKVDLRLDQPNSALELYNKGLERFPKEISLLLGIARIYDGLLDMNKGLQFYKRVLTFDSSNLEAIACVASHHFYSDQPEVAMKYYKRLMQMGVSNTELWNNLGLCSFYSQQYDMTLSCFEKALRTAEDDNLSDVWYNLGIVAVGLGDILLAHQAFKISVSMNTKHAESFNNLGVLELRKGNPEQAKSNFALASQLADYLYESQFNEALFAYKHGDYQLSNQLVSRSLRLWPSHEESKQLKKLLESQLCAT